MNDTQILDNVLRWMKSWVTDMQPAAPLHLNAEIEWAGRRRAEQRVKDVMNGSPLNADLYRRMFPLRSPDDRYFQDFWKCKHYPSAIDNWKARDKCEHGCEKTELRWYDNGCHSKPAI